MRESRNELSCSQVKRLSGRLDCDVILPYMGKITRKISERNKL